MSNINSFRYVNCMFLWNRVPSFNILSIVNEALLDVTELRSFCCSS